MIHFFSFLSRIPLYGYAIYLCINLLMGIWVVYNLAITNKAAMNNPKSKCESEKNKNSKRKHVFFGLANIS